MTTDAGATSTNNPDPQPIEIKDGTVKLPKWFIGLVLPLLAGGIGAGANASVEIRSLQTEVQRLTTKVESLSEALVVNQRQVDKHSENIKAQKEVMQKVEDRLTRLDDGVRSIGEKVTAMHWLLMERVTAPARAPPKRRR